MISVGKPPLSCDSVDQRDNEGDDKAYCHDILLSRVFRRALLLIMLWSAILSDVDSGNSQ